MVQSCQDSDPDPGPVSGCDVSSRPAHGVARRVVNHATADAAAFCGCESASCLSSHVVCWMHRLITGAVTAVALAW